MIYLYREHAWEHRSLRCSLASVSHERILAMTAGSTHAHLDQTQRSVVFQPTFFEVNVSTENVPNRRAASRLCRRRVKSSRDLTHILMPQLPLISENLWGRYTSMAGEPLVTSIADSNTSITNSSMGHDNTAATTTPAGPPHSVTATVDDMLVAYSSAQYFIAKARKSVPATFPIPAKALGTESLRHHHLRPRPHYTARVLGSRGDSGLRAGVECPRSIV